MTSNYNSWKFQYEINISNSPTTSGFLGAITLQWRPGMRYDFRDIRFLDRFGNVLKHCRESYSSFSTAKFWIRLPANETKILMYYGNGAVTTASSWSDTFDFFDGFTSLSTSVWTVGGSGHSISNSILTIQSSANSGYIESKTLFAPGSIVEMKIAHQSGQRGPFGFRNISTQKAAAWQGAAGSLLTDQRYANNGYSGDWDDDGVNRSGSSYNIYGVAHVSAGPKYYVNYSYRGEITTTPPGSVSLPVHIYAYSGEGYIKVDWVRVRKYAATEPVLTLGRKFVQPNKGFLLQYDYIEDTVTIEISTEDFIKDYITDSVDIDISTEFYAGQPVRITDDVDLNISLTEGPLISRDELSDYSLVSCDISKSISDAYLQLSAEFADSKVPEEGSTVRYYSRPMGDRITAFADKNGVMFASADGMVFSFGAPKYLIFCGKVIANSPTLGSYYATTQMQAADNSRNLAVQKIPWNCQVVSLTGSYNTWPQWIAALVDYSKTGVLVKRIIDTDMPDKQFVFKPETTRLEAIKEICEYLGLIINIKLIEYGGNYVPGFYAVPASEIDQPSGGLDLPASLEFDIPTNCTIVGAPKVEGTPDEKYNMVTIYGTLTSTGETTVASAYTPAIEHGERAREYRLQDNSIEEKGSTAEAEAIKWLLYFDAPRATVPVKFVSRFDFELYQRIRFGSGFSQKLREITNSVQLPYVIAFDPRDEANSKHTVDVSGVPRPAWLRVSEIKYHSEKLDQTVELKLITDYIYSSADPVVPAQYSQYVSPGYLKPVSDDSTQNIQDVVDNTVDKQLTPEIGTLLSIDTETKTGVVQTASDKLVTVGLTWL